MATISRFNAHPDEFVHVAAAKYYQSHWLPPAVYDPEIRNSFSVYGHSRLTEKDLVYFFTGKFSLLAAYFVTNPMLSLRLFNCSLFLILVILFVKESRKNKPFFLVLLISPQIWYVFSYVNSDAFGLFLSMIISYQIIKESSIFNQFFHSPTITGNFKGAIAMAILLALQILSKSNYYLMLIFFAIIALIYFIKKDGYRKIIFYKGLILIGLTLFFIAPRYLYDVKLYGLNKNLIIAEYSEKYAGDRFKNSSMNQTDSYPGLHLRKKGVKFFELFSKPWNWHKAMSKSFFGVYGYMSIIGSKMYYQLMLLIFAGLLAWMTFYSVYHRSLPEKLPPLIFYLLFLLIIFLSINFSWVNDFQPQGRFLFPILGILGYWFTEFEKLNKTPVLKSMVVFLALSGLYSFVFVALANIPRP